MSIYNSMQWQSDLDIILGDLTQEMDKLESHNVLITGASGLVGSAITDLLIRYNEKGNKKVGIYAMARDEEKMRQRFCEYFNRDYFHFISIDFNKMTSELGFKCDFIIHAASNSSPKDIMTEPVETMTCNFEGARFLLNYARAIGVKKFLYVSSSEVYGSEIGHGRIKEEERGLIDFLNLRNSYSVAKLATEALCFSYSCEYGLDVSIVRPGHLYGPTAKKSDNHVATRWVYEAIEKKDIYMKSDGKQVRSYIYCLDCAAAILMVLLKGKDKQVYNISNKESVISIKEMAQIICEFCNVSFVKLKANENETKSFNTMNDSSLDSSKIEELGWKCNFTAQEGFQHTIKVLKDVLGES